MNTSSRGETTENLKQLADECPEWEPKTEAIEFEDDDQAEADPWPKPLEDEAFHGLAGEFVRLIEPCSETDPAALLLQFLVEFGNIIGRSAHFRVEADRHYMNLFTVLVGETSRGRKGTSLGRVLKAFEDIDKDWTVERVVSGLSSGEGLKYNVRDATENEDGTTKDAGVDDKRLLVTESEFASVLAQTARAGNTLSATIRNAWDTGNLRNLTKNDPIRATGAHISIVGHITKTELLKRLEEAESQNGFANRILWAAVRRSKLLPFGGNLPEGALSALSFRLHSAVSFGRETGEVGMDSEAARAFKEIYPILSRDIPGMLGAVTNRAEAQVRRLDCLYALLDRKDVVELHHLSAALEVWRYCEESARYIFGDATGDTIADTILAALRRSKNGMTRREINDVIFQRHKKARKISAALRLLESAMLAHCTKEQTAGRPVERWKAGCEQSEISEQSELRA